MRRVPRRLMRSWSMGSIEVLFEVVLILSLREEFVIGGLSSNEWVVCGITLASTLQQLYLLFAVAQTHLCLIPSSEGY